MSRHKIANRAIAAALYDGDGTRRDREQIITQVAAALEDAEGRGHAAGVWSARESVLREALAIARGAAQEADNRVTVLEKELRELLEVTGKTVDV